MHVPFARLPAFVLARALIVAGADSGPSGEVVSARENSHVNSDLCDQDRGYVPLHSGDGHQQGVLGSVGLELLVNVLIERLKFYLDVPQAS